jgi:hypothetical protein
MTDFPPFPIFILLAALLICLLVLLFLIIIQRTFDLAERLTVFTKGFRFTLLDFEYRGITDEKPATEKSQTD